MDEEKNSVKYLQRIKFSRLKLQQRLEIIALGRLKAELNMAQEPRTRSQTYTRKFNLDIYTKYNWLTGCPEKNAFFCFPCLLFGGDSTWTETGLTDLKHLNEKNKKHERCEEHLRNVCKLAMSGAANIKTPLTEEARMQEINKHNADVKKNRDILSKIIDCVMFCGKFELPMRPDNENECTPNPEMFAELLKYAGQIDESAQNQFLNSSVFKETSKSIQNEILDCILSVCKEEIRNEIKRAKYLAIMVEDTSDVSEYVRKAIVFRYELAGVVYERLWGFFNPKSKDAASLAECIEQELEIVLEGEYDKLVAQTYDGAPEIIGERGGVQTIIKQTYRAAHFVQCYAHKTCLLMEQAACQNMEARCFLSTIAEFRKYFAKSPERLSTLDVAFDADIDGNILKDILGHDSQLNFHTELTNTVYQYKETLIKAFQSLIYKTNFATVQGAMALLNCLYEDEDFDYFLNFFYEVMPIVDSLDFILIDCAELPAYYIRETVDTCIKDIEAKQVEIRRLKDEDYSPRAKIMRLFNVEEYDNDTAAKEICDYLILQVRERFKIINYVSAPKLFFPCMKQSQVKNIKKEFPIAELQETIEAYPSLDEERLKTELMVLYERPEFKNLSGVTQIYDIMYKTGIYESFVEVFKLLQILITTPNLRPIAREQRLSTFADIKAFLKRSTAQNQLTALAMLSVEKNMIANVTNFKDKVLDKFVNQKDLKMEFTYKDK